MTPSAPAAPPGVIVVGGGVAGTAAALAAARAGARVTLVDGGAGATTLSTGAIDLASPGFPAVPVPRSAVAMLGTLGGYVLGDASAPRCVVVTTAGVARAAHGRDEAVLDVAPLAGQRVAVARCPRPGWDASILARSWGEAYAPIDAAVVRHVDERVLPDADFAARHDATDRIGWLAARLREALASAGGDFGGVVLPPSLGIDRARAAEVSAQVGIPCGEATALPGGPSGLRFDRARDRALAAAGIDVLDARASSVTFVGGRWVVVVDGETLATNAVVLATGGLLGGGIEYAPVEAVVDVATPARPRPPVRIAVDAPLTVGARGRPLEASASPRATPESLAWPFSRDPLLSRAGALAGDDGAATGAPSGLFAAGELVADAPRTWLAALSSGIRAGDAAAAMEPSRRGA